MSQPDFANSERLLRKNFTQHCPKYPTFPGQKAKTLSRPAPIIWWKWVGN